MTDQRRPTGTLVIDNAHADGTPLLFGAGYDWTFESEREEIALDPEAWASKWIHSDTEVIPGINALSLRAFPNVGDMLAEEWTAEIDAPHWRTERPGAFPRRAWWSYTNATQGSSGRMVSSLIMQPRVAFHNIEFEAPFDVDQDNPPQSYFELLGGYDADSTLASPVVSYRLVLAAHGDVEKYPLLYRSIDGGTWTLVDQLDRNDASLSGATDGKLYRTIWMQLFDGQLLIRLSGAAQPWIYKPETGPPEDPDRYLPQKGPIAVQFKNHAAMFHAAALRYPATGSATPRVALTWPSWVNRTVAYVGSFGGEGSVTATEDKPGWYESKPIITLTRAGGVQRTPLVYVVHEKRDASPGPGSSASESMRTRSATLKAASTDHVELVELSYRRRFPRDFRFNATIRDPNDYWADKIRENMKVEITAGWQETENAIMTGYIMDPGFKREADQERGETSLLRITGSGWIMGRFHEKKPMLFPASPEGWDLAEWIEWLLARAGFAGSTSFPSGVTVSRQFVKRLQHRFSHDTQMLAGIDAVCKSIGWMPIREKADGSISGGTWPVYSGTPDYTLDEATNTGDDRIEEIETKHDDSARRNFLGVVVSDQSLAIAFDEASMTTPGADDFLGDWFAEVLSLPDATNPLAYAQRELIRRQQKRRVLRWTRPLLTSVEPGEFVKVTVDNVGVPADTVMQIIEDEGKVSRWTGAVGTSRFTCEVVET